ncbi:MAG: hypothetical protein GXP62_22135 [Oligoflexia bacterium]|nr:hypothetical protein [Oligoflexia bacterium]
MSLFTLALFGLWACQSSPKPAEPSTDASSLPSPPSVAAPSDAWTPATISGLAPTLPTHHTKVPVVIPATPEIEAALTKLGKVVDTRATDPTTPWAIGHGLLARGPDLVLSNGQPAVDWVFEQYGQILSTPGGDLLQFPETKGDVRVEPHSDLMLKGLTEAGVSPDRIVTVQGKPHPVADLWRGSLIRTYLAPDRNHSRYSSPDDIAWSLQGLTAWAPPGLSWVAIDGTPMNLDDLTDYTAAVLYKETRVLAQARAAGQPFKRQGQGIFRYTCGGAHLLQGVSYAVMRGFGSDQARAVVDEQVLLQFYRFPIETNIYQQALAAFPNQQEKLQVQRLKFAGHFLESMSKMAAMGIYSPDDAQVSVLKEAAAEIVDARDQIDALGLLTDLDAVRARDEQLYLDIVGDSAHSIRGLGLALGRTELSW